MEPRMLDKINDLAQIREQQKLNAQYAKDCEEEILNEIADIVKKAGIQPYQLINLGHKLDGER